MHTFIQKAKTVIDIASYVWKNRQQIIEQSFRRWILTMLAPFIIMMFGAYLAMSSVYALADAMNVWWNEITEDMFGPNITSESTFLEYANDAETLLNSINFERFQPEDFGYFMVTEDDLRLILQEVVSYEVQVKHNCNINAAFYHHWFDYTTQEDPNDEDEIIYLIDHGLSKTELHPTYSVESMETSSEYRVYWQEIYAMVVLASLDDSAETWADVMEEYDADGDGVMDGMRIVPVDRIDAATLNRIVNEMKYTFNYWWDASVGNQGDHPTYARDYTYDEMENRAYIEVESGEEKHTGCSEDTLIDVAATEENKFNYTHKKLPATAPNYAQNAFKTVLWYYDASTHLMKYKRTLCDPEVFVAFGEEICGENFDFGWYVDLLSAIPGTDLDGNDDLMGTINEIYDAYKAGTVIDSYDAEAEGVNQVKLGDNIAYIDPGRSDGNGNSNDIPGGSGGSGGNMVIPENIDVDEAVHQPINVGDRLTKAELEAVLAAAFGTDNLLYQARDAIYEFQQSHPNCSVLAALAIFRYESGGTSNKALTLYNFGGITGGQYYETKMSSDGIVRKWRDFKTEARMAGASDVLGYAVTKNFEYFYDKWIVRESRVSYYDMESRTPIYCGTAPLNEEAVRWMNTVAKFRKSMEAVIGR